MRRGKTYEAVGGGRTRCEAVERKALVDVIPNRREAAVRNLLF